MKVVSITSCLIVAAMLVSPASADPLTPFGGHFYTLTSSLSTWTAAEAEAVSYGGHLVTINTLSEENFLVATYLPGFADQTSKSFWIGINDQAAEGTFNWVSGEPVTYRNWHSGEPNNFSGFFAPQGEDYGVMNWHIPQQSEGAVGDWNDAPDNGINGALNGPLPLRGIVELNQFAGVSTPLTIDPTRSHLTMTADLLDLFPFIEQTPGSMTTALQGTLTANMIGPAGAFTAIRLESTNEIVPVGHPGPFLPGDAPADLAGYAPDILAYAAFRDSLLDVSGGFAAIDASGNFSLASLLLHGTSTLDFQMPEFASGSSLTTLDELLTGTGTVQQIGNTLTVTIPFDLNFSTPAPGLEVWPINYRYTGQIVASGVVPEPSTLALAALGIFGVAVLRRGRHGS